MRDRRSVCTGRRHRGSPMKQVIVVNDALALPRGKLATAVSHASIAAFLAASPEAQRKWLDEGMPKVVLLCDSETEVERLHFVADRAGLPAELVRDEEHSVATKGKIACLGLGPADNAELAAITDNLRMVR
jgi:PTH2 family peptidyl-tRNA hydrolase